MAASKTPRGKSGVPREPLLNLSDIRALARVVSQYDLSEIELDNGSERLRIRRDRVNGAAPVVVSQPVGIAQGQIAPLLAAAPDVPAARESEQPDDGSVLITSPFVGTFYQASGPESDRFVEVGQTVKKGQVLCIVEAMKLMNEIESDNTGTIVKVFPENNQPVEFGERLFALRLS